MSQKACSCVLADAKGGCGGGGGHESARSGQAAATHPAHPGAALFLLDASPLRPEREGRPLHAFSQLVVVACYFV